MDRGRSRSVLLSVCEDGWRRGAVCRGLFQVGIVERPNEVCQPADLAVKAAAKVIDGQPLTAAEEDALLFGDLSQL
jgi:hypothetical protein